MKRSDLYYKREDEVAAVMKWTMENPFVVSLNLKDGDLGVGYPWADNFTRVWEKSTRFRRYPGAAEPTSMRKSPDEGGFKALANLFTSTHPLMKNSKSGCLAFRQDVDKEKATQEVFPGSLQDFTYLFSNCLEITASISCVKKPLASNLQVLFVVIFYFLLTNSFLYIQMANLY